MQLCVTQVVLVSRCDRSVTIGYPEQAPAFVAVVTPVLTSKRSDDPDRTLQPVMRRLLNEFGDREDVLHGIARNIGAYGWSGSRATYYELTLINREARSRARTCSRAPATRNSANHGNAVLRKPGLPARKPPFSPVRAKPRSAKAPLFAGLCARISPGCLKRQTRWR
jgi:hypothetical protein